MVERELLLRREKKRREGSGQTGALPGTKWFITNSANTPSLAPTVLFVCHTHLHTHGQARVNSRCLLFGRPEVSGAD